MQSATQVVILVPPFGEPLVETVDPFGFLFEQEKGSALQLGAAVSDAEYLSVLEK
jgi:hypothetical protein